jgi:hypothetical protein
VILRAKIRMTISKVSKPIPGTKCTEAQDYLFDLNLSCVHFKKISVY